MNSADIGFLLTGDDLDSCGVAFFNSASNPLGLATHKCARGGLSFGHEIAHIFGCDHDRTSDSGTGYGFGHLITPKGDSMYSGFRTIMA